MTTAFDALVGTDLTLNDGTIATIESVTVGNFAGKLATGYLINATAKVKGGTAQLTTAISGKLVTLAPDDCLAVVRGVFTQDLNATFR